MIQHTFLIRATLRGWTVSADGREIARSWSRILAEEAAMDAALNVSRSGAPVEVVMRGPFGGTKTLASTGNVRSGTPHVSHAPEQKTAAYPRSEIPSSADQARTAA